MEGEYLFFRRENSTLIKEHVSRISYKRLQLRKRFFGGGGELRLPKQEIGPSGRLEEVCNHKFKGSAGELEEIRRGLLTAKISWENRVLEECAEKLDEVGGGAEDYKKAAVSITGRISGCSLDTLPLDDLRDVLEAGASVEEELSKIVETLMFVEISEEDGRRLRERALKIGLSLEEAGKELDKAFKVIKELVTDEYQRVIKLSVDVAPEALLDVENSIRALRDVLVWIKKYRPELIEDIDGKIEELGKRLEEIERITKAWPPRKILTRLQRYARSQSKRFADITATQFIEERGLRIPITIHVGTRVMNLTAFPRSLIVHELLEETGRYAGAVLVDAELQLNEFLKAEEDEGLYMRDEGIGKIYAYKGYDRALLATARASPEGIGLRVSRVPSRPGHTGFLPDIFEGDLESGLRELTDRYGADDHVMSILCSNGGTGKALMLLAEYYLKYRMIEGFRTRFIWTIGRKEDYYYHDPKQLWDVPLVLAFHAFANTETSGRKLIDIVGGIEAISRMPLSEGVITSMIPILDHLLMKGFLNRLWSGSPWGLDPANIRMDLEELAKETENGTVFSLTYGELISLGLCHEVLTDLDAGNTVNVVNKLSEKCKTFVERAFDTLGFERRGARLMMIYIVLPRVLKDPRILNDVYRGLFEHLKEYLVEGGKLRLCLFIGSLPPAIIVRVFPDQKEIVRQSVRWLGGLRGFSISGLREHINECIEAFDNWRTNIDRRYIEEIIRAWERLRDQVLPQVSGGGAP